MQNLRARAAAERRLKKISPLQTIFGFSGKLVKTSDVVGVSGHAILPGFITLPISQAHCVHYSCPPGGVPRAP